MSDEKYDPQTGMTYIEGADGKKFYLDNSGQPHAKPSEVIAANQQKEPDWSRGSSGGCGQKAEDVPDPQSNTTQDTKK